MRIGVTHIDLTTGRGSRGDAPFQLTALEVRIVGFLRQHRESPTSRETLEREVWEFAPSVRSEAVPVGMRRLKKKLGPDVLLTVRGRGWQLAPTTTQTHTLPIAKPLFGRDDFLHALEQQRERGRRHFLLHGPPGMGKTHVAHSLVRAHEGSWVWVDATVHSTESALLNAIGDQLDLVQASIDSVVTALARSDTPLIVIDHWEAEHDLDFLRRFLDRLTEFDVCITSRVSVDHSGLHVTSVPRLSTDASRRWILLELSAAGVRSNPQEVERLVDVFDGHPAALEQLRTLLLLGVPHLLKQLTDHPSTLVHDTLAPAWQTLSSDHQAVLQRCAAIGGIFSIPTALALGADVEDLTLFRRQSWMHPSENGHLEIWPSIRRYCEQQPGIEHARTTTHTWVLEHLKHHHQGVHTHPRQTAEAVRPFRVVLDAMTHTGSPSQAAEAAHLLASTLRHTGQDQRVNEALQRVQLHLLPSEQATTLRVWRALYDYRLGRSIPSWVAEQSTPMARWLAAFREGLRDPGRTLLEFDALARDLHPDHPLATQAELHALRFVRQAMSPDQVDARIQRLIPKVANYPVMQAELHGVVALVKEERDQLEPAMASLRAAMAIAENEHLPVVRALNWAAVCRLLITHDLAGARDAGRTGLAIADTYGMADWRDIHLANIYLCSFLNEEAEEGRPELERLAALPTRWPTYQRFLHLIDDIAKGQPVAARMAMFDWTGLERFLTTREPAPFMKQWVVALTLRDRARAGDAEAQTRIEEALRDAEPVRRNPSERTVRALCTFLEKALQP